MSAQLLTLLPAFKGAVESVAGGFADYTRSVGKGYGEAVSSIGQGIGDRISGKYKGPSI